MTSELLRAREVANLIGVAVSTIYRWMDDDEIAFPKPVKMGSVARWRFAEIRNWIDSQANQEVLA